MKYIGPNAFEFCDNLKEVVVYSEKDTLRSASYPEGIVEGLFAYCKNLTTLVLPSSIKTIEFGTFMKCDNLKSICFLGTAEQWNDVTFITDSNYGYGFDFDKLNVHIGHVEVKTGKDVAATYFKTGKSSATKCKYCGLKIKEQSIIPKKTLSAPKVSSAINSSKGTLTLKWNKVKDATGYQISYTVGKTTKTITVKATSKATLTKIISKLTKGKTYSVKIRAYRKENGKTVYSAWSTVKKVKVTK